MMSMKVFSLVTPLTELPAFVDEVTFAGAASLPSNSKENPATSPIPLLNLFV